MYFSVENLGNTFFIRDDEGDRKHYGFQPQAFFKCRNPSKYTKVGSDEQLVDVSYDSCREFRDVIKDYRTRGNDDLIFGTSNLITQYMNQNYKHDIDFDISKIRIFNIDIEVYSPDGFPSPTDAECPVNAITIVCDGEIYTWGLIPKGKQDYKPAENVNYIGFEKETDLLTHFLNFWKVNAPHVITGWNTQRFDMPYLFFRIKKLLGTDAISSLSPWEHVKTKEQRGEYENQVDTVIDILGIEHLDYLALYKKFELRPRENYKLDTIAKVELGEQKVDYGEHKTLDRLYLNDYQKFIEYNIQDTLLVSRMEEKKKLLELAFTIAYYAKINFEGVFSPITTWQSIIYHYLLDKKTVPAIKFSEETKSGKYKGGYVAEPEPAMHKWVVSFDLASLYPSIIRQYNIGAETLVPFTELPESLVEFYSNINEDRLVNREYDLEELHKHNLCMSASGFFFRRDQKSFLSELMEDLFNKRKEEKRLMFETIDLINELKKQPNYDETELQRLENKRSKHYMFQFSFKILLNSCYGMLGSTFSDWYDIRLAESITNCGRLTLKWAMEYLNQHLSKFNNDQDIVVYGDSVAGSSEIVINGNELLTIEDYYNSLDDNLIRSDKFGDVKRVETNDVTPSISANGELSNQRIISVMEHEVEKEMFEVSVSDSQSVIVTEDHSIMVERDSKIIAVTPNEFQKSDLLIGLDYPSEIHYYIADASITSLGIQKQKVYDLEVEENHNFFANGICVHNTDSVYMSLSNIVEAECEGMELQERLDWVAGFCDNVISKIITKGFDEMATYLNVHQNTMDMEREIIADQAIWSAKKKYMCNVYDEDGKRYQEPKLKIMGMEFIKSTLSDETKEQIKSLVVDIFAGELEETILKKTKNHLAEFRTKSVESVALNKTVNAYKKYLGSDGRTPIKGATQGAKAVIAYNNFIKDANLSLQPIREGTKVKLIELIMPNPCHSPIIAFDDEFPEELKPYINYDVAFEKSFMKPLKTVTTPVGWSMQEQHALEGLI